MGQSVWFWNAIAKNYAKSPITNEAAYQHKLKTTQSYLTPEMDVLEIGCGTGSTAIVHAPLVRSYLATDFSDKMLAIAKKKVRAAGLSNLTVDKLDIDAMGYEPNSFDAVLAMSILHLLPDYKQVVKQLYEVVKPGGFLISSTVCMSEINGLPGIFGNTIVPALSKINLMPPVQRFDKPELEASFTEVGFALDHVWQPKRGEAVFIVAQKPVK
ncbi:class I SAM-dependent methyltransferase [Halocynthiibacter sp. C4]|uniref:class I SAM-dependent methyltransferase n=1 Tax=Halocynthiibacter sp. C4 TaxID=2992758 RepID=UPI00237A51A5|nr:class I SAM-dependent methyltransferase [Halocynthiibacter sp. C4]MDE0590961.1 class I SAM-dependent methyltransferase [Halocynthiibacter sp. C4]